MFPTFRSIITDIQTGISHIPEKSPALIYIGVGTYAGLAILQENINIRILSDDNYHQYPPFIRQLKHEIDDLNIYIILIDPIQENPPHMITDEKLGENFRECEDPNKFKSADNRVTTYVLRQPVTMSVYNRHNSHTDNDITNDLEYLNRYCIENTVNLLYHDFSGRQVKYLAEYFDSQLNMYLDRIIYGFNARQDTGCYFDLNNSIIPYRIKHNRQRISIKFYNIFKYLQTKKYYKIDNSVNNYDNRFKNIILSQKQLIIDNICLDLNNHGLATMRVIHKKINGDDELVIHDYHFNYIKNDTKKILLELLKLHNYHEIYRVLFDYFKIDLNIICLLKKYDLSGHELLNIITSNPNPYLWVSEMIKFGVTNKIFD